VSVLFADLVGFTPFAEERDSEDVRETLSRYFDTARETIERYGGTVEKFIGDAVMAVWGAPTAHEDDAERAVRAALDLIEAVPALGPGIQARAGVLTGEAAVTVGATNQGMVAGDLVNTASRLQSVAPAGAVLVGEQTQLAAAAAIAFERIDDQTLKGKASPVPAWRALRVVAERGGRNRAETLEAPFVGRQEEMRFLKDLFHGSGREKRVRVLSVIGPAGIGKSRLVWEFLKYIDGLTESVYWHSGRSPAYGQGISFWALGEMIRERCGLHESDDEATTRARVKATVAEFVRSLDEQSWIEKSLLTLLGFEAGMAADQLFGAWRTFFERISEQGTVVLAFEDMQFADTGLLDFVDHMLDWSRGLPIFVVTLARPELIERRPNWGAGKRNFTSLYLEPLSDLDMRELLAGLVPGLPPSAVAAIVGRADGIPLYAVETVRSLLAEGRLRERDGVYEPNGDLSALTVPATLTALIASRLDALDALDRQIVRDGAVLGQSFSVAALSAVGGMSEEDLDPRLASLVQRELLQRSTDARSPEAGQYAFVQGLIREVAYNTLSKHDRKKVHLAAARYFESLASEEIAGALASHYFAAFENATPGPEADALASQAKVALKAAAARAASLFSFAQSLGFLEQALSVTNDPQEQWELLTRAGESAWLLGDFGQAEDFFRRSIDAARGLGNRNEAAHSIGRLGYVMIDAYRSTEASALLEPAIEEFKDIDEEAFLELAAITARVRSANLDSEGALALLESTLTTAERRGFERIMATALFAKSNALYREGRRRESMAITDLARQLAEETGQTDLQLRALGNLAIRRSELDWLGALDDYRAQMDLARRTGRREQLLSAIANFGYSAFLCGEWQAGLDLLTPVLSEEMPNTDRMLMLNNQLILRASRGDDVSAGLAELVEVSRDLEGPNRTASIADVAGNAAMASGDFVKARDEFLLITHEPSHAQEYVYRAAHPVLWLRDLEGSKTLLGRLEENAGSGPGAVARLATVRAGVAALEGRTVQAMALYRDGLRGFRVTNAVWDEALTGLDMAALLDTTDPDVATVLQSTREILERMGAKPYLERLAAAIAQPHQPVRSPSRAQPTEVATATS
jgi:class 3 adenylate cyclase/tetratricopeptide (TPR) repeat protein